ncbi:MAG: hypothetical protein M3Z87_11325 [Lactobacillus sp.]|nr:hypothetical protein [Lactobacillus sp.]
MANHLEELRKQGNFTPQNAFHEEETKPKYINNQQETTKIVAESVKYVPGKNQRKTIKISPQTKAEIEELKRELRMGYNYEVIQFLIDTYVHDHLNIQQQKRFHENSDY